MMTKNLHSIYARRLLRPSGNHDIILGRCCSLQSAPRLFDQGGDSRRWSSLRRLFPCRNNISIYADSSFVYDTHNNSSKYGGAANEACSATLMDGAAATLGKVNEVDRRTPISS